MQPYFEQGKVQVHYMDTSSFALSVYTNDIFKDFYNMSTFFDFSNLNKANILFGKKKQKMLASLKLKLLKISG